MGKRLSSILLVAALVLPALVSSHARAEAATITKSYTYVASAFDSEESSGVIALAKVKLLLFNAVAGSSAGDVGEAALLAPSLVSVREVRRNWDGRGYEIEASVAIDPGALASELKALAADSERADELRRLREREVGALSEIETLKKEGDLRQYMRYEELVRELVAVDASERGYAALARGSYLAAEKFFTKAIEINPKDAAAYYNRGTAQWLLENYDGAIKDFRKALELRPGYARAARSIEQAEKYFDKVESTVAYYNRAIAVNPANSGLYYGRGLAHWELGNYDEAVRDFTMFVRLRPGEDDGFVNRGGVYLTMEEYEAAIKDFETAIELNPENSGAYFNMGLALLSLGRYEEAIESFGRVIEISPQDAEALFNRGTLYEEAGRHGEALSDMKSAARLGHRGAQEFLMAKGSEAPVKKAVKAATAVAAEPPGKGASSVPVAGETEAPGGYGAEETAAAAPRGGPVYAVQVGAFSDLGNADSLVVRLKKKGYPSYVRISRSAGNETLFRVLVGRYADEGKALDTMYALGESEKINPFVTELK